MLQKTKKMNALLQQKCIEQNYIYFDPYANYTDEQGCLKYELSDTICHIKDNTYILEKIKEYID